MRSVHWMRNGGILVITLVTLSIVVAQTKPAKTPAPETLLPANSVLYVGVDGIETHAAAWKKTAAYEALQAGHVLESIDKVLAYAAKQGDGNGGDLIRPIYDTVLKNGVSLSISLPETKGDGPTLPMLTVVLHNAANLKPGLAKLMNSESTRFKDRQVDGRTVSADMLPDLPGGEVAFWNEGGHLVVAAGVDAAATAIAVASGKSPNITTNPLWASAKKAGDFKLTSVTWVDAPLLRKTYGKLAIPMGPGTEVTVDQLLAATGLNGLGPVVSRGGLKDRALVTEMQVNAAGSREGLVSFLDQPKFKLADLPPLPPDATYVRASSLDLKKGYGELIEVIRKLAKLGPPVTVDTIESFISQIPVFVGVEPEELFAGLGAVYCLAGSDKSGKVLLAVQVKDAAQFKDALETVLNKVGDATGAVSTNWSKEGGRDVALLTLGNPAGNQVEAWVTIDKSWLFVCLSQDDQQDLLARLNKKSPALELKTAFGDAVNGLPAELSSVTLTDTAKTYTGLLALAEQGLAQFPALPPDFPLSAKDIPDAGPFVKPLFPNVSYSVVDKTGMRSFSRSSLPTGAGGPETVAVTAVSVALLLPAVQQARIAARRAQSMNNMKQIGLALHNYHDSFNTFPRGAVENAKLKPEKQLSWITQILPFIDQAVVSERIKQDQAWDSGDNATMAALRLFVLLNPQVVESPEQKFGNTNYVGMAGVGKDSLTMTKPDKTCGIFGYNRSTKIQQITDGTSNTIMVTEVFKDFTPWAQAQGSIRALTSKPYINGADGIGGPFRGGCHVLLGDGSVRFVSKDIDPKTLEALSTMAGNEVIGDF